MSEIEWLARYDDLLRQYLHAGSEDILYLAQRLSKQIIAHSHGPEEVLERHLSMRQGMSPLPAEWESSFQFLREMMVYYGMAYRDREELLAMNRQMMEELSQAASLQQSLLPDVARLPVPEDVELGVVSVAARQVSGDFYSVFSDGGRVEFAIADVSGKSMPAAILMSMIKFAMDEIYEDAERPHLALESLNRFVLSHSESSMFVTMFWGEYDAVSRRFYYSSAGHEPAIYYSAREGKFHDLSTEGPALGLSERFPFRTRRIHMAPGDYVLLYTDGVIEERQSERADDNAALRRYMSEMNMALSAQHIVEALHRRVMSDRPFNLLDDQTLLLFRIAA